MTRHRHRAAAIIRVDSASDQGRVPHPAGHHDLDPSSRGSSRDGASAIEGYGTDGPMTILHASLAGEDPVIAELTTSSRRTMSLETKMLRKSAGEGPR